MCNIHTLCILHIDAYLICHCFAWPVLSEVVDDVGQHGVGAGVVGKPSYMKIWP